MPPAKFWMPGAQIKTPSFTQKTFTYCLTDVKLFNYNDLKLGRGHMWSSYFLWAKSERGGSPEAWDKGMEQVEGCVVYWDNDGAVFAALIHRRPGFGRLCGLLHRVDLRGATLTHNEHSHQQ